MDTLLTKSQVRSSLFLSLSDKTIDPPKSILSESFHYGSKENPSTRRSSNLLHHLDFTDFAQQAHIIFFPADLDFYRFQDCLRKNHLMGGFYVDLLVHGLMDYGWSLGCYTWK